MTKKKKSTFQENIKDNELSEFIETQKERNEALGRFVEKISVQIKKETNTIDLDKTIDESINSINK